MTLPGDGWRIERGIGETRAARIADGAITDIRIERDSDGVRAGTIDTARVIERGPAARRARVALDTAGEVAMLEPVPAGCGDGTRLMVEVVRSAVAEAGRVKPAKVRPAQPDARVAPAARLSDDPAARPVPGFGPDPLEDAGWSDWIEIARTGAMAFPGGQILIAPTPAMTLIDIDGEGDPVALATAGVIAAARAIRALDIGGSIGIDCPALPDKAARQAVATAFDAALDAPASGVAERTAINGFGLLHLVRRRSAPSLIERVRFAPVESAALDLLRRGQRAQGTGGMTLTAAPAVAEWLSARTPLLDALADAIGRRVAVAPDATLGLWSGHVG